MNTDKRELRSGRQYRKIRANFINQSRKANQPCWLCGEPIDYHAKGRTRNSPELDHRLPARNYPHLVREPSNFRIAHAHCNQSRGCREPGMHGESPSMHGSMHKTGGQCIKPWIQAVW